MSQIIRPLSVYTLNMNKHASQMLTSIHNCVGSGAGLINVPWRGLGAAPVGVPRGEERWKLLAFETIGVQDRFIFFGGSHIFGLFCPNPHRIWNLPWICPNFGQNLPAFARILTSVKWGGGGGTVPPCPPSPTPIFEIDNQASIHLKQEEINTRPKSSKIWIHNYNFWFRFPS